MRRLTQIIDSEIADCGPISFNRFMELALYCPELGFYEKEADNLGRNGDFFTSVSVGPLFGELLAFQFSQWFQASEASRLQLIEAGAHDGRLASDVLSWIARQRPEVFEQLRYTILEPSSRRRDWQKRLLSQFSSKLSWIDSLASNECHSPDTLTIVFSNELLDAMPVRRFGWDAAKHEWFEWGVGKDNGRFAWVRLSSNLASTTNLTGAGDLKSLAPELLEVLPDGYTVEVSPAAERWWGDAARWLKRGKLVTIDYGFDKTNQLLPERTNGTLRAYRQHQLVEDVLADPGSQDITAHVNFPRIEDAGIVEGLHTERFETQSRFLTCIAAEAWKPDSGYGEWGQKETRQFQTLTHPDHLGNRFRVLVQSRSQRSTHSH